MPVPSPIWMTIGHIKSWLFLSEELWVVLFVDVHVIVGEHYLTFFSFQFQYKKTRIIMPRAYCKKVQCVCI
jgi:hypothetical protein